MNTILEKYGFEEYMQGNETIQEVIWLLEDLYYENEGNYSNFEHNCRLTDCIQEISKLGISNSSSR